MAYNVGQSLIARVSDLPGGDRLLTGLAVSEGRRAAARIERPTGEYRQVLESLERHSPQVHQQTSVQIEMAHALYGAKVSPAELVERALVCLKTAVGDRYVECQRRGRNLENSLPYGSVPSYPLAELAGCSRKGLIDAMSTFARSLPSIDINPAPYKQALQGASKQLLAEKGVQQGIAR